ncbi:MAG TPA: MerR family transcriptional regulator [Terracidiphilus sp.]|jgi:DNA-binding transcriptional MerR regulator
MASHPSPKRAVEIPTIPDRLYFKIGDVARLLKLEPYVLRFWESQFPQLKPNKSGTGQRLYRKRDVEIAVEIKRLVYGEGYTLSGARQALGQQRRAEVTTPAAQAKAAATPSVKKSEKTADVISRARVELREIAGMLATPAGAAATTVMPHVHAMRRKARPAPAGIGSGSLFDV